MLRRTQESKSFAGRLRDLSNERPRRTQESRSFVGRWTEPSKGTRMEKVAEEMPWRTQEEPRRFAKRLREPSTGMQVEKVAENMPRQRYSVPRIVPQYTHIRRETRPDDRAAVRKIFHRCKQLARLGDLRGLQTLVVDTVDAYGMAAIVADMIRYIVTEVSRARGGRLAIEAFEKLSPKIVGTALESEIPSVYIALMRCAARDNTIIPQDILSEEHRLRAFNRRGWLREAYEDFLSILEQGYAPHISVACQLLQASHEEDLRHDLNSGTHLARLYLQIRSTYLYPGFESFERHERRLIRVLLAASRTESHLDVIWTTLLSPSAVKPLTPKRAIRLFQLDLIKAACRVAAISTATENGKITRYFQSMATIMGMLLKIQRSIDNDLSRETVMEALFGNLRIGNTTAASDCLRTLRERQWSLKNVEKSRFLAMLPVLDGVDGVLQRTAIVGRTEPWLKREHRKFIDQLNFAPVTAKEFGEYALFLGRCGSSAEIWDLWKLAAERGLNFKRGVVFAFVKAFLTGKDLESAWTIARTAHSLSKHMFWHLCQGFTSIDHLKFIMPDILSTAVRLGIPLSADDVGRGLNLATRNIRTTGDTSLTPFLDSKELSKMGLTTADGCVTETGKRRVFLAIRRAYGTEIANFIESVTAKADVQLALERLDRLWS
ncbi:hypothetical protein SAICODRAFT_70801 [Saitoella complicata NRRL Y-17804]|uniref:uncharacterized protein n=1 Tax=Saitoella complicata (strain BCRC 22490 / CBS 7301 / JCM 7358 / NBRC 10748 / NRRL Y-17804) TaxID=698492 RepID=UPI000866DA69|nr:uncharacterized protein SAICODRAFT_70801 [Saitoella complicata NRRL Y-17804]ODQ53662.1 hypothetical protein SAICODRAFT_70801 [Saitoella complicata NRRL Y-17804]